LKILVTEDDQHIASVIKRGLEQASYAVDLAEEGNAALRQAQGGSYSLILLDLSLPGLDGLSVCRGLRERGVATPILMLTARDALDDRVRGLETGADDYLVKPFAFPELIARVRALLRRDHILKGSVIRIADLEIDRDHRLVRRDGQEIPLTAREFTLLEALAAHKGRVLSREFIRDRVWNDEDSYSNNVETFIKQLRKKIDRGPQLKLIHTVHGMGYSLRNPKEGDPE
jgi:two-component system copper resistance phosphate regulon response regulator CusR